MIVPGKSYELHRPKPSDWEMRVCNVTYVPPQGEEPCWFHRKMQELCFGFKWRKRR
jgi:hypothetical protein